MKAKVTRPDGTSIELEGETAEVTEAIARLSPAPLPSFQLPALPPMLPQHWPLTWTYTTDKTVPPPIAGSFFPSST